jgi:PAS domain S-box-containing protein
MRIRNDWRVLLLFVIGIVTTFSATFFVKLDIDKINKSEFGFECKEISNRIDLRLHAHARLLQSGVAFWSASDVVDHKDWHEFVKKLKINQDLPGILGTGFSQLIRSRDLKEHCNRIRKTGFPDYKVWPEQKRDIYTAIVMLEPFNEQNLRAFGYDMMTEPIRREAMERARDEDVAALSGKVLLVQEADTDIQAGNLMYVPVYQKGMPTSNVKERRTAIIGWIFSPYRMNDLIRGILDDRYLKKEERTLHLAIYDGIDCTNESLLFESGDTNNQNKSSKNHISSKSIINFNGHSWSLVFTQENSNIFTNYIAAWTVFFGGIVISILLLLLAASLIDTKYKAQQIAESLTFELKENERQLNQSQKIASLGRYSLDIISGHWTSSKILDGILGIETKESHSIDQWLNVLHPDDRDQLEIYLKEIIKENRFFDKEYRIIRNNDQQVRWMHGLGQPEYNGKNKPLRIIGTIRDITEQKLAELEIQNISNRLQLATSAAHIGVWDRDFKASKIIWDDTMYELFGFSDKSIDPTTAWETALHPEDKVRLELEIQEAIKDKKEYHTEFRVIWPDQSIHYLRGYGMVSFDEDGNPIRILGIDMDITEQKQANQTIKKHQENLEIMVAERTKELTISEQKLKKSFKDISDYKFALDESSIVAITDNKGTITSVNDLFCKISKFTEKELIGQNHRLINSGYHSKSFFKELWHTIASGNVWRGEIKNKAKDGTIYWVDSTVVPFLDENGKPYQYMVVRFDITSKKITEEAIISAKEVADSANKAKSEFLANMSHEIRTPMNAVIGFSDLLAKSVKNKKQLSQVESIRSSGKNLLKIINDILDLSKVEAGKIEILPVVINLPILMNEIKNMFAQTAKEKEIYFAIEYEGVIPNVLMLDEVRVRQILFNLIGNAIKFTDKGHVVVTVDAQRNSDTEEKVDLLFRIEDTGIGVPKSQQELIFEPFSQQEHQSSKYGGTGLGLSITKKLIQKMGGRIDLKSEMGKGSSFSVLIPNITIRTDEIEITDDTFDHTGIEFKETKILLADDNSENRKLIKDLLECSPIQFFEAVNGEEAVTLALKELPDLILMDLRMPVMNGYEATEILRENPKTQAIPILAISASTRKIIHNERSKEIFNGYLMKPLNASNLFRKMQEYLTYKTSAKMNPLKSPKESIKLSDKQIEQLPKLIDILETNFIPRHKKISKSQMIDHIEKFGFDLKIVAEEFEIEFVTDYAKEICRFVDNFEIDKLTQLLKEFPMIIEQLKNYTTK